MKFQLKIGEQTFEVEVGDLQARPILATVDGETFAVMPEEVQTIATAPAVAATPAATPAPVARAAAPVVSGAKALNAPLPGTIVAVLVKAGDAVKAGQELITLEAMKMKNAIRASRDGVVAVVHVSTGDTVRHGQALLEFAD